jgi:hypothetical protein
VLVLQLKDALLERRQPANRGQRPKPPEPGSPGVPREICRDGLQPGLERTGARGIVRGEAGATLLPQAFADEDERIGRVIAVALNRSRCLQEVWCERSDELFPGSSVFLPDAGNQAENPVAGGRRHARILAEP